MQNNITNKGTCSYYIIGGMEAREAWEQVWCACCWVWVQLSRWQQGGWLVGRVGVVVVVSRWSWQGWLWHWWGEGRGDNVEVALALVVLVDLQ